jgi:hypothetical protein
MYFSSVVGAEVVPPTKRKGILPLAIPLTKDTSTGTIGILLMGAIYAPSAYNMT